MDAIFKNYSEINNREVIDLSGFSVGYDTSALLDLYRLSDQSRIEVLDLIEKLGGSIGHFIPYYVAFEVSKNKGLVKNDLKNKIRDFESKLGAFRKSINGAAKAGGYSTPINDLKANIESNIDAIEKSIKDKHKEVLSSRNLDDVYGKLSSIFSGKVSDPFLGDELSAILANGRKRYASKIPPGFADDSKSNSVNFFGTPIESKYGDYIIWEHLIDWSNKNKKGVIFITSDKKDDWIESDRICPDLAAEFNFRTGFDIHIFTLSIFERKFRKEIGLELSLSSSTELEEVERVHDGWLGEVIDAFKALGGECSLDGLYEYIEANTDRVLTENWKSTVRRTIYYHSSDMDAYRGKKDLFKSKGKHSGNWLLREGTQSSVPPIS